MLKTPVALVVAAIPLTAQQPPPVRPLGPVVARSSEALSFVPGVRALSGGRVLVNDVSNRRVLLFDSTLATFTVVADTTAATANAYGGRFAGLIAYRGDSTLFVDPASLSMLVIDPSGRVGRVMSVPRAEDVGTLAGGGVGGTPAFDASGRLVYRTFRFRGPRRSPDGAMTPPEIPDTMPIVRIDLATRQLDTVGFIKTPRPNMQVSRDADGRMSVSMTMNPLPVVDEWAVLADGSIAFVRGRDYHVDWVNPDGSRTSSPKMPFEWQRMTDEDKVAFIDSVKAARERMGAAGGPQLIMSGVAAAAAGGPPPEGGGGTTVIIQGGPPGAGGTPGADGGPSRRGARGGVRGGSGRDDGMRDGGAREGGARDGGGRGGGPRVNFVSPSELPDYKPPFFAGAARADADGNLWIRTIPTKALAGGPVYDVVSRQGGLVDRVQLPAGRTIVGFGAGGVVYLTAREGAATYLERARVR